MPSLLKFCLPGVGLALAAMPAIAANHREAPITALDEKADITDVYAFRSYEQGLSEPRVTFIMCVDPLLEPGNGPTFFPFDPSILYTINVDNDNDALADVSYEFRFFNEINEGLSNAGLFTVYAGFANGAVTPANTPNDAGGNPFPVGVPLVPPQITSLTGPGSLGLALKQFYTVTEVRDGVRTLLTDEGGPFYTIPANAGPRTMNHAALVPQGIYTLDTATRVACGTFDDAFWIDLGGVFDTINMNRQPPALGSPANLPLLTAEEDASSNNIAPDFVSGYAVNAICLEVPVTAVTRDGVVHPANDSRATIGMWCTTSRPRVTVRRSPLPMQESGTFRQVQRMANPLVNELLIGIGSKDRFSMDEPVNDVQFANFLLNPLLPRVANALVNAALGAPALVVPNGPRVDLLPLVTYSPAAAGPAVANPLDPLPNPANPIADLLRLNTGVEPTPPGSASRLGGLAGDAAGFPNGRRVFDDVTDIALRVVVGGALAPDSQFPTLPDGPNLNRDINNRLGDGVNSNDAVYRTAFPYLADAPSGRDRRHIDPSDPTCPTEFFVAQPIGFSDAAAPQLNTVRSRKSHN